MVLMIIAILIVAGLCFGSFVNALVWRLHEQAAAEVEFAATQAQNIIRKRGARWHSGRAR